MGTAEVVKTVGTKTLSTVILKLCSTSKRKKDLIPWLEVRDWEGRDKYPEYKAFLDGVRTNRARKRMLTVGFKLMEIPEKITQEEFKNLPIYGAYLEIDNQFIKQMIKDDRVKYVIENGVDILEDKVKLDKEHLLNGKDAKKIERQEVEVK